MASQAIMDAGTESTMTKHRRAGRRGGTSGLDDEHLSGQHCLGRHHAPHLARRTAPAERARPSQREGAEGT